ncbi:MAG: TetR/AcrR family transcriptional regulator [Patulibacter minatonensis]
MSSEPQSRRRAAKRLGFSERRDSLLDTALHLVFHTDGFSLSMAQIAEHEGVSKPVVYDHFANIDELLSALYRRELTEAVAEMLRLLQDRIATSEPEERLQFALERARLFLEIVHERPERWRLTFEPPLAVTPETRELTERGKGDVHRAMIELLAWALPNASDLDLSLTAHAVQAVIERMTTLLSTRPADFDAEELVTFAVEHIGWWAIGRATVTAASSPTT